MQRLDGVIIRRMRDLIAGKTGLYELRHRECVQNNEYIEGEYPSPFSQQNTLCGECGKPLPWADTPGIYSENA